MDDRNPLSFEQVQQKLADSRTLECVDRRLEEMLGIEGRPRAGTSSRGWRWPGSWCAMPSWASPIPEEWRRLAIDWLENEEIDWEEETIRQLRRRKEIELLKRAPRWQHRTTLIREPDPGTAQ